MAESSNVALRRFPLLLGGLLLVAVIGLAPFDMAQSAQGGPMASTLPKTDCMGPARSVQPGRATCPMDHEVQPKAAAAAVLIALMFSP